jgi:hypothetical protein
LSSRKLCCSFDKNASCANLSTFLSPTHTLLLLLPLLPLPLLPLLLPLLLQALVLISKWVRGMPLRLR